MNEAIDYCNNLPMLTLSEAETTDVKRLAAVGFMVNEIAALLELRGERRRAFLTLALTPGTHIAQLIAAGRADGRVKPQLKLQEVAEGGDVEAIRALQDIQERNRFNELLYFMDDDEFTP